MKTFIEDLKKELKKVNISEDKIEEIIGDHEEMIEQARLEGLSDDELLTKFGDPVKIARACAQFENSDRHEDSKIKDPSFVFEPLSKDLKIQTKLVDEDVDYKMVDSDQIKVLIEGKARLDRYVVNYDQGLLKIEVKKTFGFDFNFSKNINLIVEIPKSLSITEFKHSSVNGDLCFTHITCDSIDLHTVNGDIDMKNIQSGEFKINTVNGDVNIKSASFNDMHLSTVSGDFQFEDVEVQNEISLNGVSGDLHIKDSIANSLYLSTVSGDVHGDEFYIKQVSLSSVSGDIHLNNSKKQPVEILKKKTLSGDIHLSI